MLSWKIGLSVIWVTLLLHFINIRMEREIYNASRITFIQVISIAVWAITWYSDSALVLAKNYLFFVSPRYKISSYKDIKTSCGLFIIQRFNIVCISVSSMLSLLPSTNNNLSDFNYLRTIKATFQWTFLGWVMNWLSFPTTRIMSGSYQVE